MIEFNGQISGDVQYDRAKRVAKSETKIFGSILIICCIVVVILGITTDAMQGKWFGVSVVFGIMLTAIIVNAVIPKQMMMRIRLCPHIIITETEILHEFICISSEIVTTKKSLNEVKKVLDCGEVYYIILKFDSIINALICQKSNLVTGTIEEFENLFQSKIVRMK